VGWKTRTAAAGLSIALGLVATWEGFKTEVYLDPVGIPTVCYGHVEKGLVVGETFSFDRCHELLTEDLLIAASAVDRLVTVELKPNVQAAMISFVYNVGAENFRKSTLRQLLNENKIIAACHELPKWVYAKGKKLKGLVNRRQAEMKMCLGDA
jgi:lysozyme